MWSQAVLCSPLMLGCISFNHYQAIRLIHVSVSYTLILFLPLCFNILVSTLNRYWHTALNKTPWKTQNTSLLLNNHWESKWHARDDGTQYVLLQFTIHILRGGTKIVKGEQFSANKMVPRRINSHAILVLVWGGGGGGGRTVWQHTSCSRSELTRNYLILPPLS